MPRKYEFLLKDIYQNVELIFEFISDLDYDYFKADMKTMNAVIRCFEVIGEAISGIPDDIKENYPNVEWKNVKDFRNMIVHQYWKVDSEIMWDIIKNDLRTLKVQIDDIIVKERIKK